MMGRIEYWLLRQWADGVLVSCWGDRDDGVLVVRVMEDSLVGISRKGDFGEKATFK